MLELKADALERSFDAFEDDGVSVGGEQVVGGVLPRLLHRQAERSSTARLGFACSRS
jgi:hypothetical protein